MHPTADTTALIFSNGAGRRVMPGVRLLGRFEITADRMRGSGGWLSGLVEAPPAVVCGLTSGRAGSEGIALVGYHLSGAGRREVG
jgi:hypothetical protein